MGLAALQHAGLKQESGFGVLFTYQEPVGIFTARAAPGTSDERLDASFTIAVEDMLRVAPGAFAPWPPWADRIPGTPVVTFPGDEDIDPWGLAMFRIADPARAEYAMQLGRAARRGLLADTPEAPS